MAVEDRCSDEVGGADEDRDRAVGGAITVDSAPEAGSAFTVYLPLAEA